MALKAMVAKLDEVAEGFRTLYKASDGGYVLDVESVEIGSGDKKQLWSLENVHGLKTSLGVERDRADTAEKTAKQANDKLAIFGELGEKPEKLREKLTKYEELVKLDPKKEADKLTEERVKLWTTDEGAKYQAQISERDNKIGTLTAGLTKALIENEAVKAITAAKGKVKPLLPHILSQTRLAERADGSFAVEVVQVKDGKEIPRIGAADGSPMTIMQLVDELKADADFGGNFEGTRSSGSGANQSNTTRTAGADTPKRGVDRIRAGLQKEIGA